MKIENNIKPIIALLPMKGHSERVPRKNFKEFAGFPLYHHVLKTLTSSDRISKVVVNTDSEELAKAVLKYDKVIVHMRPDEICGDFVSMNKIIEYDMGQFEEVHFLQTHATNPCLQKSTISAAIDKYREVLDQGYDSVFSVTKLQTRLYKKNGEALNHNPNELIRTQDLDPLFEENSNFFIFSKDSFMKNEGKRIGQKPFLFETNRLESIDIDDPEDFQIAEYIKLNHFKGE